MRKFAPLEKYLKHNGSASITLRFSDIERIIGEELCPSARKYHAYWHLSKTHMLPQSVDDAGYQISSVDLSGETVVIRKKAY